MVCVIPGSSQAQDNGFRSLSPLYLSADQWSSPAWWIRCGERQLINHYVAHRVSIIAENLAIRGVDYVTGANNLFAVVMMFHTYTPLKLIRPITYLGTYAASEYALQYVTSYFVPSNELSYILSDVNSVSVYTNRNQRIAHASQGGEHVIDHVWQARAGSAIAHNMDDVMERSLPARQSVITQGVRSVTETCIDASMRALSLSE